HSAVAQSEQAATDAAAARDAAMLGADVFKTVAEGLAATTNGQYFKVVSSDLAQSFVLCRNNNGAMEQVTEYPSIAAVKQVANETDAVKSEVLGARARSPDLNGRFVAI